jgi:hypothetical protein
MATQIKITCKAPKARNQIAREMCEYRQFRNRVEPNKKKIIKKFDFRKEMY